MSQRRNARAKSVARQATQLALAVPQVIGHRVARMALAGHNPSARDRREFKQMVDEKKTAFSHAWIAMSIQSVVAAQELSMVMLKSLPSLPSLWSPWLGGRTPQVRWGPHLHSAALGVLDKGMAPVRKKAVANSRRLARTKLR